MSVALQQLKDHDAMAEWQIIRDKAEILVKSGFLPNAIKTPEQALAIILTGRELGIGDMQALNNINVIAGKPTIPPQLMLALINRTRELEDLIIEDDGECCTVIMKRRGKSPHKESFSMKDASMMKTQEYVNGEKKTISLSEKYNWKQQPQVMRKWRAVAKCARVAFPDVIAGLYTPDELGAHTIAETGEIEILPEAEPELAIAAPEATETVPDTLVEKPSKRKIGPKTREILENIFEMGWNSHDFANYIWGNFGVEVSAMDQLQAIADLMKLKKHDLETLYVMIKTEVEKYRENNGA